MAKIFKENKIKELVSKISSTDLMSKIEIVKRWHDDYHNGSLKADKETSREQSFNQDFFVRVLGYAEKPEKDYSLEPKATSDKGQLPDAILGYFNLENEIKRVFAVVELKGASISLDKPQKREGNMSPIQQAFKYKSQYRTCPFVLVSNFYEFRLFQDTQLDYEIWTLDDLVNPKDDYFQFKKFYYLLNKDNFTSKGGQSHTQRLLSELRIEQEEISKKFYGVYKDLRLELLRDIYQKNEDVRTNIEIGIEKVQKIIDRIVFICFCEDRGLLPDNTLPRTLAISESAFGSLWGVLKGLFEAVDKGSDKLEIPNGYNGGLFKDDIVLNNLRISDTVLKKLAKFGEYNFAEDLSVTILGHIFEQSITDLEEIKQKAQEANELPIESLGKRKKDGIFYTPDFIVDYIIEHSLGALLQQKEQELKIKHKLKDDIQDENYEKRSKLVYTEYQSFLQNIKVLDPACGSGAFLVRVFDYLLKENQKVGYILGGSLFSVDDYVRSILTNNIYGVDLNSESVEITKLSLWLKTAQKGKKLTTLDNTIRCGNSLIENFVVAGEKAFDWSAEFESIIASGGFDVIVGNPPYVLSREKISVTEKEYFKEHYSLQADKPNLYFLFMEKSFHLLKENGMMSFIVPNTWLGIDSAINIRKYILENFALNNVLAITGEAFKGVSVETSIFALSKRKQAAGVQTKFATVSSTLQHQNYKTIDQTSWYQNRNHLIDVVSGFEEISLLDKIKSNSVSLGQEYNVKVGLQAYETGKGKPPQTSKDVEEHVFDYTYKFDDNTFPYLQGGDVGRYSVVWSGQWLRWGDFLSQPKDLGQFNRQRILIREITSKFPRVLSATWLDETFLSNKSTITILPNNSEQNLKPLVAVLNSALLSFWQIRKAVKGNRSLFPKAVISDVKHYPIPQNLEKNLELGELAELMLALQKETDEKVSRFNTLIGAEFNIEKFESRLKDWWFMNFNEFCKTLKMSRTDLARKDSLLTLFEKYKEELLILNERMEIAEKKINSTVYELYGLTQQEIALIEGITQQTDSNSQRKL